jgi:membrane protein DedA with SNARE-associated domain
MRALVLLFLVIRLKHGFHGPTIDYVGLAAAASASWIGVPGPGEPVLVATGISAAKHHLDITSVLIVAWVAAMAAGMVGWGIGFKAGRRFVTAPGPLYRLRTRAVRRGDEVFERYTVLAIVLTPTWVAGIHHVRPALYLPINAVSAGLWAAGIGLSAYFAGPAVLDFVDDLDAVVLAGLVCLIVVGLTSEFGWRRRRRRRDTTASTPEP